MARLGRYFLSGEPLHVVQRGSNRQAIFHCDDDYRIHRGWLAAALERRVAPLPPEPEPKVVKDQKQMILF